VKLFQSTKRPDKDLFYKKNDPNDVRLGEVTGTSPSDYSMAEIVLLGCPQDMGVIRNQGREGARFAPDAIRRTFYTFPVPEKMPKYSLCDVGNIRIQTNLEDTHTLLENSVSRILEDGKYAVVLGGGNDISYPDVRALNRSSSSILVFNVDSHLDVRTAERPNSGTPYRQLLEEGIMIPENFYEMAYKPLSNPSFYEQDLKSMGAHIFPLGLLREKGIEKTFHRILRAADAESIFWGFDMDVVRANDAPGVSAPYPTGLTAEEVCSVARTAGGDRRSRVLEISEVNPLYDIDDRTSRLAAMIILNFLKSWTVSHSRNGMPIRVEYPERIHSAERKSGERKEHSSGRKNTPNMRVLKR
jgi:formimidoylglutamase